MISAVLLIIMAITVSMCDQCCKAYECSDYKSSSKCSTGYDHEKVFPCVWENNACRKGRCGDVTSGPVCDSYESDCQWNSTDCVTVNSCGAWSGTYISDCVSKQYNDILCFADGQTCKPVATCADLGGSFGQEYCEESGLRCKYNAASSTCVAASSCSDWNNDITHCSHLFYDKYCFVDDSVCKAANCADFGSSQATCELLGCKYSGGSCTEVSSCSGWSGTNLTACQNRMYDNNKCIWENNTCRKYTCDDFDGGQTLCESGSYTYVFSCKWKDNKCVYYQDSCEASDETGCDISPSCTYLSGACPSPLFEESTSFKTFVPTTMVVLAVILSLLW